MREVSISHLFAASPLMTNPSPDRESRKATVLALGFGAIVLAGMAGLLAHLKPNNLAAEDSGGSSGVVPIYYASSGTGRPFRVVYLNGVGSPAVKLPAFSGKTPAFLPKTPAVRRTGVMATTAVILPRTPARADFKRQRATPQKQQGPELIDIDAPVNPKSEQIPLPREVK